MNVSFAVKWDFALEFEQNVYHYYFLTFCLQNIKLSSIKVDTRYTTTQQVVKLIGSHTISKVTVKIGDLKRTKMVRTINLYYNNRTVQAIVELKNKYVSALDAQPFFVSFPTTCVHFAKPSDY